MNSAATRLLILEDDPADSREIGAAVEDIGFSWRRAARTEELPRLLEDWRPSVIILELSSLEGDGIQTLQGLAAQGCSADIIIVSRLPPRVIDAAQRAGQAQGLKMAGALAKPFSKSRLKRMLRTLGEPKLTVWDDIGKNSRPDLQVCEPDLKCAIDKGEFTLAYQGRISCETGALAGFEAQARWEHPQLGVISATDFLPIAYRVGLIEAVDEYVVEQALEWFSKWRRIPQLTLSLSVSIQSILNGRYIDRLTALCQQYSLSPTQIILQITGCGLSVECRRTLEELTRIRIRGFGLALDHYGVGGSSPAQLLTFPFSEIKTHPWFAMTALHRSDTRLALAAIAHVGRQLGLNVVCDGVANFHALHLIRRLRYTHAQGDQIAHPICADAADVWIGDAFGEGNMETGLAVSEPPRVQHSRPDYSNHA